LPKVSRNIAIVGSVVLFHVAALWALQAGLLHRAPELIVPVRMLSEMVAPPPPPEVVPPQALPPSPQPPPRPARQHLVKPAAKRAPPPPRPQPLAPPAAQPAPNAPTGSAPPAPAPPMAAGAAPDAGSASPGSGAGKVEMPSSDAGYLQNPAPRYPAISKRMGEQGKVVVRVLIGADGSPQTAELKRSSGYERLDRSALEYVMKCRYVPGKVGGVPQAMWYEAPVNFVLE
jgi:periplasmic protein TonB